MKGSFFLLRELVRRDVQSRYAGSLLGLLWAVAQPLWLLALFTFVFSTVMKITPLGERTESFGIFLFCGLLPWMAIHEGIFRSATAITDNGDLVKKASFPSELLVVSIVLAALVHQAIAAGVFVVVLAATGELSIAGLPYLALAVPLQVLLTLGCAFFVACLHLLFRDTAQLLGMVLNAWFYLTPIVYPMAIVPDEWRGLVLANPLSSLVALYRRAFLGATEGWTDGLAVLAVLAIVLFAGAFAFFRRLEPDFADEV